MPAQLLNRPEIISVLQEVNCEAMLGDGRWQLRTERCAGGANASEWAGTANWSPESGRKSYPWSIPSGQLRRSGRRGNGSEITPACLQRLAKWPNYRYINHEKDSRHVVHGINILLSTAYYSSALHSPNNASPWVALAVWFALALQFAIARSALAIDFLSNYRRFHMGVFVGVQRRFQSHVLF